MIGIICAINQEVEAIVSHMQNTKEMVVFETTMYEGNIAGKDVVVANSGVGKVNAAITTSLLLSQFQMDCIINVGVAGGLDPAQEVADVVIAKQVIQHDFDTSPVDQEEGIGLYVECDEKLAMLFKECVEASSVTAWLGDVASGDCFVTKDNHYERIKQQFPSCMCAEMEAGAIAQTCARFKVPCLIIRTLSDVVPKEGNAMDFVSFANTASKQASALCAQLLAKL